MYRIPKLPYTIFIPEFNSEELMYNKRIYVDEFDTLVYYYRNDQKFRSWINQTSTSKEIISERFRLVHSSMFVDLVRDYEMRYSRLPYSLRCNINEDIIFSIRENDFETLRQCAAKTKNIVGIFYQILEFYTDDKHGMLVWVLNNLYRTKNMINYQKSLDISVLNGNINLIKWILDMAKSLGFNLSLKESLSKSTKKDVWYLDH